MMKSKQGQEVIEVIEQSLIASAIEAGSVEGLKLVLTNIKTRVKELSIQEYLSTKTNDDDVFTIGQHILNASASYGHADLINYLLSEDVNPFELDASEENSCFLQAIPEKREAATQYLKSTRFLPDNHDELDTNEFWTRLVSKIQSNREVAIEEMGRVTPILDALVDFACDE